MSRHKLLSPCERFSEEKKLAFKSELKEASAKRKKLEKTSAKIQDTASTLGNTGQRCSIKSCERNHTVCTCLMAKCESVFF